MWPIVSAAATSHYVTISAPRPILHLLAGQRHSFFLPLAGSRASLIIISICHAFTSPEARCFAVKHWPGYVLKHLGMRSDEETERFLLAPKL